MVLGTKNLASRHYDEIRMAFWYGLFGVTGALVDAVVFVMLRWVFPSLFLCAAVSYLTGAGLTFFLNIRVTFSLETQRLRRFVSFLAVSALGGIGSATTLSVLLPVLGGSELGTKILLSVPFYLLQYGLNRRFAFAGKVQSRSQPDRSLATT